MKNNKLLANLAVICLSSTFGLQASNSTQNANSTSTPNINKEKFSWVKASDYVFDGPYIGAGLVKDNLRAKTTSNFRNGVASSSKGSVSSDQITGEVFAGYGKTLGNNIYIGAEVAVKPGSKKTASSNDNVGNISSNYKIKKGTGVSVAGRVGKQVTDNVLLYGKAGIGINKYNSSYNTIIPQDGINVTNHKKKTVIQPLAGAGLEVLGGKVSRRIRLVYGAEYEHGFKQSMSSSVADANFGGTTKSNISYDAIKARVGLKF